ncbi:MAG: hypothetical protein ABR89_06215, partial [Rhodobacter sp. BACL10 MAG-120910-bin24]
GQIFVLKYTLPSQAVQKRSAMFFPSWRERPCSGCCEFILMTGFRAASKHQTGTGLGLRPR